MTETDSYLLDGKERFFIMVDFLMYMWHDTKWGKLNILKILFELLYMKARRIRRTYLTRFFFVTF